MNHPGGYNETSLKLKPEMRALCQGTLLSAPGGVPLVCDGGDLSGLGSPADGLQTVCAAANPGPPASSGGGVAWRRKARTPGKSQRLDPQWIHCSLLNLFEKSMTKRSQGMKILKINHFKF